MTPLARIARLSSAFLGSNLARAAIGFGLSFALARGLGAERFGRWILCTAWASTLTVLVDLGLGVLLTRDGSRHTADAGRLLGEALALRLALAVPLAALLLGAAGYVASDPETVGGLRVAAFLGTAGAVYGCFGALFRSQPRWLPVVLAAETGWLTIQLAAAVWVRTGGIVALLVLAVFVQLGQIATAVACWRTVFGKQRVSVPSVDSLRSLVRRALPFAASGLVANVQTRIAPLMLGYFSTPLEVGFFGAAARFGTVARMAPQAIFAGALPVLTHEHGRDRQTAERVFLTLDGILLAGAAVLAGAFGLFAAPALRLVYGAPFESAAPALVWIGIGLVPLLSNSGRRVFLFATGGEAAVVRWSAMALAVQICASAMLMPLAGAAGAAIALAAGEAVIWWPLRRAIPSRATTFNAVLAETADAPGYGGLRP